VQQLCLWVHRLVQDKGLTNLENIQIIVENANVPVIVDAGIGAPSEATQAMEIGASWSFIKYSGCTIKKSF
jgi:thiazole synthase ThiGH ThiG subunit